MSLSRGDQADKKLWPAWAWGSGPQQAMESTVRQLQDLKASINELFAGQDQVGSLARRWVGVRGRVECVKSTLRVPRVGLMGQVRYDASDGGSIASDAQPEPQLSVLMSGSGAAQRWRRGDEVRADEAHDGGVPDDRRGQNTRSPGLPHRAAAGVVQLSIRCSQ